MLSGTQYLFIIIILKAYSLISYRGRSQKFQNLNFLQKICSFPPRRTFPQRSLAEIISLWN